MIFQCTRCFKMAINDALVGGHLTKNFPKVRSELPAEHNFGTSAKNTLQSESTNG